MQMCIKYTYIAIYMNLIIMTVNLAILRMKRTTFMMDLFEDNYSQIITDPLKKWDTVYIKTTLHNGEILILLPQLKPLKGTKDKLT